ncbi:MAG: hypothetical protein LUB63_06340, partial [Oscillospiraceae bacterium]|nr:hypothetical protein [Oscillospiraceae bacterium]
SPKYHSLAKFPAELPVQREIYLLDDPSVSRKLAADRGFNPRTHRYEMMNYKPLQMMMIHGLLVDETFVNPYLKGLYAVGDAAAGVGGAYGACTSGLLVGRDVDKYIADVGESQLDEGQIAASYQRVMAPAHVEDGVMPMELECAVRHIMERYCGALKSEGKLTEGIRRLESLKRDFLPKLMAPNPHYLMRAMEVRNIFQLAELHLYGCYNRRETRGQFVRLDYPETDHSRDDYYTVNRIVDGEDVVERVLVPDLNPEVVEALKQS